MTANAIPTALGAATPHACPAEADALPILDALDRVRALADAPPDGYEATVETGYLDAEHRIGIHLRDRAAPWMQAACRVFVPEEGEPELYAAFAVDLMNVALREDVPRQEAAVAALATALERVFGSHKAPFLAALEAAWARRLARLEARWTKAARSGGPDETGLCLYGAGDAYVPAIAARLTGMGDADDVWGLSRCSVTCGYGFGDGDDDAAYVTITQERLATLTGLSGHEKLDLLGVDAGPEYARARMAFDEKRVLQMSPGTSVQPMRRHDLAGFRLGTQLGGHVSSEDGGGFIGVYGRRSPHSIWLYHRMTYGDRRLSIGFGGTKKPNMTGDRSLLDRVLTMILAKDEPIPAAYLSPDAAPCDPSHPALRGLHVPERHRHVIGAILELLDSTVDEPGEP